MDSNTCSAAPKILTNQLFAEVRLTGEVGSKELSVVFVKVVQNRFEPTGSLQF